MRIILLKDYRNFKTLIQAADPTYKKTKAFLSPFVQPICVNSYWDEGSKSGFALVGLTTKEVFPLPESHPFYQAGSLTGMPVKTERGGLSYLQELPEGIALIETGWLCGKVKIAHIYLNPLDMPKTLEEAHG